MYIEQADFFYGTSMIFAKKVMNIAEKEFYETGETVFMEGDPAEVLYVLIEGRVRIMIGDRGHVVYIVSKGGGSLWVVDIGWTAKLFRYS